MSGRPPCAKHDPESDWSLPLDQLEGKRICRQCGHIAKAKELGPIYFQDLKERIREREEREPGSTKVRRMIRERRRMR